MAIVAFKSLSVGQQFTLNEFVWKRVQQKGCCGNPKKHNAIRVDDETVKKYLNGNTKVETAI